MISVLRHRGPNGCGVRVFDSAGLAHTRLSIIDLSKRATQPMSNEDGNLWIVLNGEVYNYRKLRSELTQKGHRFRSASDTEVILHLYEEEGERCLSRLRGMFAFALYDRRKNEMFLARDRIGEKPLVYGIFNNVLYFASEIPAILNASGCPREIDLEALHHYFSDSWYHPPAPYTIFKGIRKLPAGCFARATREGLCIRKYWSLDFGRKSKASEAELCRSLRNRLREAVRLQLESDVPVGIMLSGGIDSSSIVLAMRELGVQTIRSFAVGFSKDDEELQRARLAAKFFGTKHTELIIKADDISRLPEMIALYGEPISLLPAFYTFELSRLMNRHVTVVLTGNGGDELFGGYDYYNRVRLLSILSRIDFLLPHSLFGLAGRALGALFTKGFLSEIALGLRILGSSFFKRKGLSAREDGERLRRSLYSPAVREKLARSDTGRLLDDAFAEPQCGSYFDRVLYADLTVGNSHSVVVSSDVGGMAHALEMRSPFLDPGLLEFSSILPERMKVRSLFDPSQNKYILKKAIESDVPAEIVSAKKMGFGFNIPWRAWMKTKWRRTIHSLLFDGSLARSGLFDMNFVKKIFEENSSGRADHSRLLFALVVFSIWYKLFIERVSVKRLKLKF